jgi:hypothetical protein
MKKLSLIALVCLALAACETKYYSVLITNNSSKDVSYSYNGASDTLVSGKSKGYEVEAYTQPPKDMSVTGPMSVTMESKSEEYIFTNVPPVNLHVINTLPSNIIIKADSYIDDNGSTELLIESLQEKTTANIYTENPRFTVLSGYSAIIDWKIENNIIYVTIR